jgi:hypothetical protein
METGPPGNRGKRKGERTGKRRPIQTPHSRTLFSHARRRIREHTLGEWNNRITANPGHGLYAAARPSNHPPHESHDEETVRNPCPMHHGPLLHWRVRPMIQHPRGRRHLPRTSMRSDLPEPRPHPVALSQIPGATLNVPQRARVYANKEHKAPPRNGQGQRPTTLVHRDVGSLHQKWTLHNPN